MVAVGDCWLARMPRRDLGAELLVREIFVLPALPELGLGKPKLVAVGEATGAYPSRFLLLERLPGAQALPGETFDAEDARRLALALRTLHNSPPPEGLPGDVLGLLLIERFPKRLEQNLPKLGPEDRERYEEPLRALLESSFEPLDEAKAWVHGDLHVRKVLRYEGRLSAIIDWGDSHFGHPRSIWRASTLCSKGRTALPSLRLTARSPEVGRAPHDGGRLLPASCFSGWPPSQTIRNTPPWHGIA